MDTHLPCRIVLGESSFNYILNESDKYSDLKDKIGQRFSIIEFKIKASFPGHHTSMIDCDLDVKLVVEFARLLKCDYVDIIISDSSQVVKSVEDSGNVRDSASEVCSELSNSVNEVEAYGRFLPNTASCFMSSNWKGFITNEGQVFTGGVEEFREKLRKFAIENGFKLKFKKNDLSRVTAQCINDCDNGICVWKLHAVKIVDSDCFRIKEFCKDHSCTGRIRGNSSSVMNSALVASIIEPKVRLNQNIPPKVIMSDIKLDYGLEINYNMAWYGRELARENINGDEGAAYTKLTWYVEKLMSTNPGSHCVLECEEFSSSFRRLFICYGSCRYGFQFCRPLLFVDGTHIKSKFKGVLLSATGKNANQGFYSFAFAIASAENNENWMWFFERLREVLEPSNRVMNFISDRHDGIVNGIRASFPNAHHAFCYYHLTNNLKTRFPSSYSKDLREKILNRFMKLTYAPTEESYLYHLRKLLEVGGRNIVPFLENLPKENFSNAYFRGERYGDVSNGVAESFNAWILDFRHLQIYEMIEGIRKKLMDQFAKRKAEAEKWTTILCPDVITELNKQLNISGRWGITRSSPFVFEVGEEYIVRVDLSTFFCSCGMWRIKRFPCAHALLAIQQNQKPFVDYIEEYLHSSSFKAAYAIPLQPVPDIDRDFELRNDIDIIPPKTRRPPGRPKTKRVLSLGESKRYKCSRCHDVGHNRSGCTAPI